MKDGWKTRGEMELTERATLAALLEKRRCEVGETVFHHGEPGDAIFLVNEGRVQVYIDSDVGDKIMFWMGMVAL